MMQTTINIEEKRIIDMLVCAFEGGSNYWMSLGERDKGKLPHYKTGDSIIDSSIYTFPFNHDGYIMIRDADDGNGKEHKLDVEAIENGLAIMAKKYPMQFANFMLENDDAETGDVFLQCCIFGEVIYS